MYKQKNINFESFIPANKFSNLKNLDKKKINLFIKKTINSTQKAQNVFHSFSKNFKLNFSQSELKRYKKFKRVIIIGFGGSILGTQAINSFLKKKSNKDLIFINNMVPHEIDSLHKFKDLKNSLFIIVSKSGNTIEVLSIINSLKKKANFNKQNTLVITENKKSHLNNYAKKFQIKIILHRNYIGGRYSVFSETALAPCSLIGININKLKKNILNFLHKNKSLLIDNLFNLSQVYKSKKINSLVLLNYDQGLEHFSLWCQQLIAESLGKKGNGIIPLISVGPRDHHSLLQLFLDGPKDNFFYIFSFKETKKLPITKGLFNETLNNKSINKVLESQKNAMIALLKNKEIPFLSIEVKKRNEETIGELFSYFILETVFMGENLKVNPFNQPAVENLKVLTKQNLLKKNQK